MAARKQSTASPCPSPVLNLLEQARTAPDDAPRLVLADWLQENGGEHDSARGELVQIQCALARRSNLPAAPAVLRQRETVLVDKHHNAWLGRLRELSDTDWELRFWTHRRGLLYVTVQMLTLLRQGKVALAESEAWAWVDGMDFRYGFGQGDAIRLVSSPLMKLVGVLNLSPSGASVVQFNADTARALASSPHLAHLRHLDMSYITSEKEGAAALAGTDNLPRLTSLNLSYNFLGSAGAKRLASSRQLGRQLVSLNLAANDLGDDGVRALSASRQLTRLEELDLSNNGISGRGIQELGATSELPSLKRLKLHNSTLGASLVAALAASPLLARLESLDLAGNNLGIEDLRTLITSPHLREGVSLRFWDAQTEAAPSPGDIKALAATPGLARVRSLEMGGRQLGARGVKTLLASPYLDNLESLGLSFNRLGKTGVRALLDRPFPPRLRKLDLSLNDVGDEGVRLLAESPQMAQITSLDLSGCHEHDTDGRYCRGVTREGMLMLAASPYLQGLQDLFLHFCADDANAEHELNRSPNLQGLFTLETWGH